MNPRPDPTADHPINRKQPPRKRLDKGRVVARVLLALWMPTVALGVGSLMVGHWAPLPTPEMTSTGELARATKALVKRTDGEARRWSLVHVL
ncbi:hypothetical protein Poly30_55130 [Planctomycetes bacterium Poly30]|uniref:Uncharacterized protein n=1 Tax=Saltatorellus ferox TaxID=2528018 RepID=A0A518F0T4_9BACT|nr:hypothetical protein Poly30_55130 [Planctomycetes bacterium Poly30]